MNKTAVKISLRIIADIALFAAVLEGWWFIAWPLGSVSAFFFPYYAELPIAGLAYDALFDMFAGAGLWSNAGIIVSALSLAGISFLKRFLRR